MGAENKADIMHHDEAVAAKLQRLVGSEAYQYQRRRMLSLLDIPTSPIAIFDVGCGEGSFCRDLNEQVPTGSVIIGLDTSPFVLNIARGLEAPSTNPPVRYLLGDAQALPFAENSFDIVVCSSMLKYLKTEENERNALEAQKRLLRPGGQLLVVDSNDYSITYNGIDNELERRVINAYAAIQGDPESGSRIEGLCQSIGLQDMKHEIILLEETEFTPVTAGYAMAQNIRDVLKSFALTHPNEALVSPDELDDFYTQLEASATNGTYGWNFTKYATVGRK